MATSGHFGWPKITFDRISRHFRSIRNFDFFYKTAAGGHFGWPKITFECISRHFRSIRNSFLFIFFSKWLLAAILEVRFGHFGWLKITFDRISRHFRSIHNFYFFLKMAANCNFGWPKITFDRISRHFRSIGNFLFLKNKFKMAAGPNLEVSFGPFWMTKNNFWSHFSPFQINTQL